MCDLRPFCPKEEEKNYDLYYDFVFLFEYND